MISDNFDRKGMDEKIKKNLEAGFTIPGIKVELRKELKDILESIQISEARAVELTDQIEYMDKNNGE